MLRSITFLLRDPLTSKRVRARHKMQVPGLQRQHPEWEITGAPEIQRVSASTHYHRPYVHVDALIRHLLAAIASRYA
jgi:hypothetical protein